MEIEKFSPKQKEVFRWWISNSGYDAVILDGAVRSGKTMCMFLSFLLWSLTNFDSENFAVCSKTIECARRNITRDYMPAAVSLGMKIKEVKSSNYFDISYGKRKNRYYIFGGKDEASYSFIQGITLAGVMFDEVTLQDRNFVYQAMARCSADNSKFWFSCNPSSPDHWFKKEFIDKVCEKKARYIHFTMDDNPSLSENTKERYKRMYSGSFYMRYVEGKWTQAEGLVYPFFSDEYISVCPSEPEKYIISADYGTVNPCSMGLWGLCGGVWYRIKEYYYDSRKSGRQKTDSEYADDMINLAGGRKIEAAAVDPSAASFIECLKRKADFKTVKADNDVKDGIRTVSDMLKSGKMKIDPSCTDIIREFGIYKWDEKSAEDKVVKKCDHAMDDMRYFARYVSKIDEDTPFFVSAIDR